MAPAATFRPSPSQRRHKKYRSITDIMNKKDDDDYKCDECGSGDDQLLLCDKCDKAFHLTCHRPVVVRVPIGPWFCFSQSKIFDFFKIKKCSASSVKRISPQDPRRRRKRIVHHKKRRRLLPYAPSEEITRRVKQMRSLASALTSLNMEYSDDLTYSLDMAPRSANLSMYEKGGMQVLSKEDTETLEYCRAMLRRGECPPLLVVFDSCEGYTVEADGPIKDLTLITEYIGDVDYIKNREHETVIA
ncbi:probable histone-lysine N-methyltransferase ATXR5 [Tanacetum coccineum]